MTSLRGALATVGAVAVGLGLLFVFRPSLAATIGVPEAALSVLGVIALVEGVRSVGARRAAEIDQAIPPDPEDRLQTSMPGEDFDHSLSLGRMGRGRVRRRLRETAIESVAIHDGLSEADATARVDDGSWTDDPVAAAFIGGPGVPPPPWRVRLRFLLFDSGQDRYYAERTVEAIADVWEDE